MAKAKKVYKRGATIAEIDAQLEGFCLFDDGDALDFIPAPEPARPAKPPKAVRLDWDPVEKIDIDAAWDALLS